MTIFKRKSTPPTVSPLAPPPPPPASTYHPQQQQQQQQQYPQTQQYAARPPQSQSGSGSGQGSFRGQQQLQPPNGHMQASPNDLARIGTNGTTESVSSRSEKRRSGFFGLGGKKDKEKERIEKEEKEREKLAQGQMQMQGQRDRDRARASFSGQPPHLHQGSNLSSPPIPPNQQARPEPSFIPPTAMPNNPANPHMSDRFPRPQSSHTPPLGQYSAPRTSSPLGQQGPAQGQGEYNRGGVSAPFAHPGRPDGSGSPVLNPPPAHAQGNGISGGRVVSSPQPGTQRPPADFDAPPGDRSGLPKSQSMGFGNPRQSQLGSGTGNPNVPETHPYRGFLNAQQDKAGEQAQALNRQSVQGGQSQGGQTGMPRSSSMPLDQLARGNGNGNARSPPPVEKETMSGSPSMGNMSKRSGDGANAPSVKQFDAVVDLIAAQPQKTYVASPPELEMILARTSAGGQPKQGQPGSASNDWDGIWLQLSGISLSMWSMKETRAAAAKGEKVPPTYFNITDSSLELLAPLPPPPHRPQSHPHHFVFSLNTAGSNRLLFSCPSERDLARWTTGLRLAAWERARLEEIYTGHLIKDKGREPKMELQKGRMEGWVRVRVMGGTDWKRLWVVIHNPNAVARASEDSAADEKKSRRRSIFGFGEKEKEVVQEPNTGVSMASFYLEPRTVKNKTSVAVLTITDVTQAYAVFPERLEVMSQSNLMKVVGRIGGELVSIEGRLRDSGWALIMPETPEAAAGANSPPPISPLDNMMRWVTGFHDVFQLYGRPERYNWDPKNPTSLFFAYPQGQDRSRLFLDIDEALHADFRLTSLPAVRAEFIALLMKRMSAPAPAEQYRGASGDSSGDSSPTPPRAEGNYRLPPLTFGDPSPSVSHDSQLRSLTPITERTDIIDGASRTNSTRTAGSTFYMSGGNPPTRDGSRDKDGAPSKQGSGASSRHERTQGSGDSKTDRLAPISDSTETFGQYTDEPAQTSITARNGAAIHSQTQTHTPTDTLESAMTDNSTWSRSTGQTPTPGVTPGVADKIQPVFPLPPTALTDSGSTIGEPQSQNQQERDLPDLPAQTQSQSHAQAPTRQRSSASDDARKQAFDMLTSRSPNAAQQAQPAHGVPPVLAAAVTSPVSPHKGSGSAATVPSQQQPVAQPSPRRGSVDPSTASLQDEPAALYLMNMVEEPVPASATTIAPSSRLSATSAPPRKSPSPERPRIITQFDKPTSVSPPNQGSSQNQPLGRKPSGARAPPPPKKSSSGSRRMESISDDTPEGDGVVEGAHGASQAAASGSEVAKTRLPTSATNADLAEDATQYLAYAERPSPEKKPMPIPPVNAVDEKAKAEEEQMRSSFAPSRAAAERRAKAEMAETEQKRAMNVPGGGKRAEPRQAGGWSDSEDEEDEEERDGDADSPVAEQRAQAGQAGQPGQPGQGPSGQSAQHPQRMASQTRALPPVPRINGNGNGTADAGMGSAGPGASRESGYERDTYAQQQQQQRGHSTYSTFSGVPDRPRSNSPAAPHRNLPAQPSRAHNQTPPGPAPAAPATRQTLWNANFSAEHGMDVPKSGKFVDLEEPNVQLTKAFAPHGLLQAGMQDKEDRSAKRQEETARELGSSLINVPSKPPPPSAGLLGAVAQHERDRKGAGGIGATLTDREREKRLAEERQREIEKLQRQQMEHMSRFGGGEQGAPGQGQPGMFGGYGGGYGMPSPGMMGMPGMPQMGGYNSAYNPYAQQQAMMAAQYAYQHTMMMSQAGGSQAGGAQSPDRPASPAGTHGGPGGMQHGGMSPSPSMPQFGNFYPGSPQPYPQWPGMPPSMPWGTPGAGSPAPGGVGMGWLAPPSMYGGPGSIGGGSVGGGSEEGGRSRVQSMYSDGGGAGGSSGGHGGERHPPAN